LVLAEYDGRGWQQRRYTPLNSATTTVTHSPVVLYLLIHLQSPSRSPATTTRRGERPLPSSAMLSGDTILMYFTFSSSLFAPFSLSLSLSLSLSPPCSSVYLSFTLCFSLSFSFSLIFVISVFLRFLTIPCFSPELDLETVKQVRIVCMVESYLSTRR